MVVIRYLILLLLTSTTTTAIAAGYGNRSNMRLHLVGGLEINKFETEGNGESNFEGNVFGLAAEMKSTAQPYSFGALIQYSKSSLDNTANNESTTETFEHQQYKVGVRLYAVDVLLGVHLVYMQSNLLAETSSIKSDSSYKGMGYGFDLGYEFNLFSRFSFIPGAYYTFVELNGDDNNLNRDGIVYGFTGSLIFEF